MRLRSAKRLQRSKGMQDHKLCIGFYVFAHKMIVYHDTTA